MVWSSLQRLSPKPMVPSCSAPTQKASAPFQSIQHHLTWPANAKPNSKLKKTAYQNKHLKQTGK